MTRFEQARALLTRFKEANYLFGVGVLQWAPQLTQSLGRRIALVRDPYSGFDSTIDELSHSLRKAGCEVAGVIAGAAPNAPLEDLHRVGDDIGSLEPDLLVSLGGGSTIDCVKAAAVLQAVGGPIDQYFGTSLVTERLKLADRRLLPHLAIQTAASSAAHLTKYSNITNLGTGQKKLIVDDAIVPCRALFDYRLTASAPVALTADGALDGLSHCLEVFYGATGKPGYALIEKVALTAISLIAEFLPVAIADPGNMQAREALGLATDLGGYAIMLGGTNGAHLTSFSLVDVLSHGRACALMNPYYTIFFSPSIQNQLRALAPILCPEAATLSGRGLAEAVARSMIVLMRSVGNPATLDEVPGFTSRHVNRALTAAQDPQLRMKLENMPVPLTAELVPAYMGPILEAARSGEFSRIINLS